LPGGRNQANTVIQKRIQKLFASMLETPYSGIGKPEPLKYDLSGKWSRRITEEDRFIYEVVGEKINVYSLRGHYQ